MISEPNTVPLQVHLDSNINYALVYHTPDISIYQREPP
jgi:hypothetical protein